MMNCSNRIGNARVLVLTLRRMTTSDGPGFSIAPAALTDCLECAGLLVEHVAAFGANTPAQQLSRVLEKVVADRERGFVLLARDGSRIIGIAYVATILSAEHCGLV